MKIRWIGLGLVMIGSNALASLLVDVNGDGAVDVADLVRAHKISNGEFAFESAAGANSQSFLWKLVPALCGGNPTYVLNISMDGSTPPSAGAYFDKAGGYPIEARSEPGYEFICCNGLW